MEIKRKLNKLAKRITPEIEAMNMGIEMKRMCDRFEEILNYCEEKQERAKRGGKSSGQIIAEKQAAGRNRIQKIHDEEAAEQLEDRQQHAAQPESAPIGEPDDATAELPEEPDAGSESTEAK